MKTTLTAACYVSDQITHTHTFINVTEDNLENWSLYRDIQYEKWEKKNKVWVY